MLAEGFARCLPVAMISAVLPGPAVVVTRSCPSPILREAILMGVTPLALSSLMMV